jgi:hypothetical protein
VGGLVLVSGQKIEAKVVFQGHVHGNQGQKNWV